MDHIAKITAQLPEHGLDAMLVTSAPGERYAVGFEGEGWVLVSRDGARYSTDGRYIEAARQQVTGAEIVLTERGQSHLALAREEIRRRGLKRVGFESGRVSADELGRWKDSLPCELVAAQGLLDGLRAAKDEEELARMRQAQRITDEAFREILNFIRPGLTEQEVAARLVYELLRRGGRRVSFDPIVAAGANGSMPHAVPGETVIQPGMFVTMDFGCVYEGYCSDMTRTVAVGQPTDEMERVYHTVLDALGKTSAPAAAPAPAGAGAQVKAPMPGTILDVKVQAGQSVKKGDVLVILEAMKMENEICAPSDGKITGVNVRKGDSVETQALLCTIA